MVTCCAHAVSNHGRRRAANKRTLQSGLTNQPRKPGNSKHVAVPRVMPQPIKSNDLQCQTFLTAPMGAKDNFLNRKTGKLTTQCYSNAKMRFQSFFMLITDQPFFFASS